MGYIYGCVCLCVCAFVHLGRFSQMCSVCLPLPLAFRRRLLFCTMDYLQKTTAGICLQTHTTRERIFNSRGGRDGGGVKKKMTLIPFQTEMNKAFH